jgi:hypothetical protein
MNRKSIVDNTRYLTDDERILLKKNLNADRNINAKMKNIVNRKVAAVNKSALNISPLKLGFFNSIINGDTNKTIKVDVIDIFNRRPHGRKSIPRTNLEIEIKTLKLIHGKFQVGSEHSLSGKFGNLNAAKNYFMVNIFANVYDGNASQGVNFRIYRSGKIHFSGGILNNELKHNEHIHKFIVDNFTKKEPFLYNPIIYNNTVGQFNVNGTLNLTGISRDFRLRGKVSYEPELRAALTMKHSGTSFQLFNSGVVQIMGVTTEKGMTAGYKAGKELADQLHVMGLLRPSKSPTGAGVVKRKPIKVVNMNMNVKNVVYNTNTNALKIGPKLCSKYFKHELVAIAKKFGIVNIKATVKKETLCDMIKAHVFGTFFVDGKPCLSYTKAKLLPMAIERGISVSDADTVKSICEKLSKPNSRALTQPTQSKAGDNKSEVRRIKRGLTNAGIKRNLVALYGNEWLNNYKEVMPSLNNNVEIVKKRINTMELKKNVTGLPFKQNINKLKRNTVRQWKRERRAKLNAQLNALNNNFAKELNNVMNSSNNTKLPKDTKLPKGTKVETM